MSIVQVALVKAGDDSIVRLCVRWSVCPSICMIE